MTGESADWYMVAEFMDHPRAELAKNLLDQHDIPAALWSDDCGGLAAGQTFIQRVRLFVPASNRQAAMEILGQGGAGAETAGSF